MAQSLEKLISKQYIPEIHHATTRHRLWITTRRLWRFLFFPYGRRNAVFSLRSMSCWIVLQPLRCECLQTVDIMIWCTLFKVCWNSFCLSPWRRKSKLIGSSRNESIQSNKGSKRHYYDYGVVIVRMQPATSQHCPEVCCSTARIESEGYLNQQADQCIQSWINTSVIDHNTI